MSLYKILYYNDPKSYSSIEMMDDNPNIDSETVDLLFEYHKCLGVTAVKNPPSGLLWKLWGYWYSQAQIERMLAIKVFA